MYLKYLFVEMIGLTKSSYVYKIVYEIICYKTINMAQIAQISDFVRN